MVSEAQKRATKKYEKEHYDYVGVRLPKGLKEQIKGTGESVNGFIVKAIKEKLERISEDN